MRKALRAVGVGTRETFTGTFVRFGWKSGYKCPLETVLLCDVVQASTNKGVTDHLWFNKTKGFAELDLQPGDIVQFSARVDEYEKGYKGYRDDVWDHPIETDYRLTYPTKLKKVGKRKLPEEA